MIDVVDRLRGAALTTTESDAYDRGVIAGEINARLAGHDKHFMSINGHLGDLARDMHAMHLLVQRITDQAAGRELGAVAMADALRGASASAWLTWQRLLAAVVAGAAVAGAVAGVIVAIATVLN